MWRRIVLFMAISWLGIDYVVAQKGSHHHDRNEIGFGFGAVYAMDDKVWGKGAHLHYFRSVKPESRLSFGCGLEQVWAGGQHFSINAGVKYELFERFDLGVMPGVTFFKHLHENQGGNSRFSLHFEVAYNLFNRGNFHLAPVVDYARVRGDAHLMPGLHLAYCF